MAKHSVFAPSAAHRWLLCPASALVSAESDPPSPAAERGRQLHALAEVMLRIGASDPQIAIACSELNDLTADEAEAVASYTSAVLAQTSSPAAPLWIEAALPLQPVTGEEGAVGTADAVVLKADDASGRLRVQIHDLKTGRTPVAAQDNPQLRLYGAAALRMIREQYPQYDKYSAVVEGWIHQPFVRAEPSVAVWEEAELQQWVAEVVRPAIERARAPNPPFAPGEKQCRWCPAAAACPALRQYVEQQVTAAFPAYADGDEISRLLDAAEVAAFWAARIKEMAAERIQAGLVVPGWVMKEGRRIRAWADADAAEAALTALFGEMAYLRELISPAQAEKLAKRKKADWSVLSSLIAEVRATPRLCRAGAPADPAFEPVTSGE